MHLLSCTVQFGLLTAAACSAPVHGIRIETHTAEISSLLRNLASYAASNRIQHRKSDRQEVTLRAVCFWVAAASASRFGIQATCRRCAEVSPHYMTRNAVAGRRPRSGGVLGAAQVPGGAPLGGAAPRGGGGGAAGAAALPLRPLVSCRDPARLSGKGHCYRRAHCWDIVLSAVMSGASLFGPRLVNHVYSLHVCVAHDSRRISIGCVFCIRVLE